MPTQTMPEVFADGEEHDFSRALTMPMAVLLTELAHGKAVLLYQGNAGPDGVPEGAKWTAIPPGRVKFIVDCGLLALFWEDPERGERYHPFNTPRSYWLTDDSAIFETVRYNQILALRFV